MTDYEYSCVEHALHKIYGEVEGRPSSANSDVFVSSGGSNPNGLNQYEHAGQHAMVKRWIDRNLQKEDRELLRFLYGNYQEDEKSEIARELIWMQVVDSSAFNIVYLVDCFLVWRNGRGSRLAYREWADIYNVSVSKVSTVRKQVHKILDDKLKAAQAVVAGYLEEQNLMPPENTLIASIRMQQGC